jgi:oligopeptide transport system substrate-binding protein
MPVLFGGGPRLMALAAPKGKRSGALLARVGIALVGMVALAVAACAPGGGNQASLAPSQVFTWPYYPSSSVDNSIMHDEMLDPAGLVWANDVGTVNMLYAGLVTYDSGLRVVPYAATWDVSGQGTIYTFHLRHNLYFSDGTPLTAADYAYSIDRALDPNLCTVNDAQAYHITQTAGGTQGLCLNVGAGYLSYILGAAARELGSGGSDHSVVSQGDDPRHGVNVIDQYTLRIRLTGPYAFFLETMTLPVALPVEKALVDKYPGGTWVDHLDAGGCSGPFKVKSYDGGKQMRMVPNPYWAQTFGNGKPLTLTEVDRPYVDSVDHEYAAYRAGQYDFTRVPPEAYPFAKGEDDFYEVPTLVTQYFELNFDQPPFDNQLVRQAFDLALNKQLLVGPLQGALVPTNHIVPLGMPGFDDKLVNPPPDRTKSLTGNQGAAQSLLKEAANQCQTQPLQDFCPYITGSSLKEIDFWVGTSNKSREDITIAAAKQWDQVLGLNVQAKATDSAYQNCLQPPGKNLCQAWAIGWLADYPDPQDWLTLQFQTGQVNNFSDVRTSALDKLMTEADTEQNSVTRMAEYNQAEQAAVDLVPWIPYGQDKQYWRQRSWVHGFGLNALQLVIPTTWANVYITSH